MNLTYSVAPVGNVALNTEGTASAEGTVTLWSEPGAVGDGVRLEFPAGAARNWSGATCAAFTLRANGAHRLRVRIDHGQGHWLFYLVPRPGLTARVVLRFEDLRERPHNTSYPGYLAFGGGPEPVDLADVHALTLTFNQVAPEAKALTLADVALHEQWVEPAVLDPRPVVDAWGQWTGERGEPRGEPEIRAAWDAEPTIFEGFVGHTEGTGADATRKLDDGTGFFRVARDETIGRWFLVDPDGYPFFSIGCDCVRPHSEGPAGAGREALFADLSHAERRVARPGRWGNPLWADFYHLNLRRRYGQDGDDPHGEHPGEPAPPPPWRDAWAAQTAVRLRRWGFNTIANWSDPDLTRRGLLPYATNLSALDPLCARLPDVFAPEFAARVRDLVAPEVAPFHGDRMLIGFFVGNEPHWTFGGVAHPFNDVFVSPEYPHTREHAVAFVRQTHGNDLGRVNAAWGADLASWEDLLRPGAVPDVRLGTDALKRDADAFLGEALTVFYETCCREIRALDPDHLLLGGRFYTARMAEPYVRACRAFDVYSFNCYQWDPPAADIERVHRLSGRPVLIGEFHYGVEGRGLTASLVATPSQHERGLAYRHFVENAAALPAVVGAHWFQWVDQPVTGRFDGECYNIGLVDITDIPYDAFLRHAGETHARLYTVARGQVPPYVYPGDRPAAW